MHGYAIEGMPQSKRHAKRHAKHALGAALLTAMAARGGRGEGERGRGRHRDRHGFGMWFGGGGPPFGPGGGFGRGPKARRGDVRTASPLCSPRSRATATRSCRRSRSGARASGAQAPARSTPRCSSSRTRGSCGRSTRTGASSTSSPTPAARMWPSAATTTPPWEEMSGDFGSDRAKAANVMREVALAFTQVIRAGSERSGGRGHDRAGGDAPAAVRHPGRGRARGGGRVTQTTGEAAGRPAAIAAGREPAVWVRGLAKSYGEIEAVRGDRLRGRAGRDLRLPRPQRRRQVDDDQDALHARAADRRRGAASPATTCVRERDDVRRNIGLVFQDTDARRLPDRRAEPALPRRALRRAARRRDRAASSR